MINYNYKYLQDREFLRRLDLEEFKKQFVRIKVLNFKNESLIANIEGKATGGTINLSGSSNVRRTMSCSLLVDPNGIEVQGQIGEVQYGSILEVKNLLSMNKKVCVEVGYKNTLSLLGEENYPEYSTIWIPLGLFVIKAASVSKSSSGINISLTLNDKTALLNGDMGGVIPAATILSENELYSADATSRTVEKILIKDIIKYLVVDLGGEDPSNVIIEDIPDNITKVMKWNSSETLYLCTSKEGKSYVTDVSDKDSIEQEFKFGDDIGYMIEPFVYPGTLSCEAGESVATVLDKIKNALGNYEWFYDINGRFHFQERKNYLNTSKATNILILEENGYLSTMNINKAIYTFDQSNQKLLTNISNNPQYQNIKNDFIIWGSAKTASGGEKPIRYHLVFDTKPKVRNDFRLCIVYTDYRGLQQVIVLNEENSVTGAVGEKKNIYYLYNKKIFHWDEESLCIRAYDEANDGWELCYLRTDDWRTELYFQGLEASNKTFAKNYYAAELIAEWPKIFNVKGVNLEEDQVLNGYGTVKSYFGQYRSELKPENYEYFLDFLDGSSGGKKNLSQFNVNNIGRRIKIGKDNTANCIFNTLIPNYLIIVADGDISGKIEEAELKGLTYINISEELFSKMSLGGGKVSAYDKVKELLYQHTTYNETISLTTIPIYYLEPNSIINIADNDVSVNGEYIINTISLPLGLGTSTISCTKALCRDGEADATSYSYEPWNNFVDEDGKQLYIRVEEDDINGYKNYH